MKRFYALILACLLLLNCLPVGALAAKQMNEDVPVWTEDTVRQYALDYVKGLSMERLWGYYDLQIRRYLPQESYERFLIELEFLTGDFLGLGSYYSFEEEELQLKTHVLHLCMERQDVEMYFTHKNQENDWEIMAVEFVLADNEQPLDASMQVDSEAETSYIESAVTVGEDPYPLEGILTIPTSASADQPVTACVLLHDFGAMDRDMTWGNTKMFADIAEQFGELDIATLRYDKRSYAYPDAEIETIQDEVISDAVSAVELLKENECVDQIVLLGVGLGGSMAPIVASVSEVDALILLGSSPDTVLEQLYEREKNDLDHLSKDEQTQLKNFVRNHESMKEEKAREYEAFGRNGYYYWEADQYDSGKLIRSLALPTFFGEGKRDTIVVEDYDYGYTDWQETVGINGKFMTYHTLRGLNHLLMNDNTKDENGKSTFELEAHLDRQAARVLGTWILNLNEKD